MKTIAAISTPAGSGGIAVIRISGAEALSVARAFFRFNIPAEAMQPRRAYLGKAELDGFFDKCILTYFPAPHSYTGEDVVEISCHGGVFTAQSVLAACLKAGALLAAPGEFTRRAFLNGKLSLSDAEGVIDLINAESAAEANAASFLAEGALSREAREIQSALTDILAEVEVAIDYPEEFGEIDKEKIDGTLSALTERLRKITASYSYGKILKNGLSVVIAGSPNAGKSSLMNALVKFDRSIVTPAAGTTRDTVTETIIIKGVKIHLADTAGIRENAADIEKLGVERSFRALDSADAVLFIFDASAGLGEEDKKILEYIKGKNKKYAVLANKCDLGIKPLPRGLNALTVSALTGENIDKTAEALHGFASAGAGGGITITNERHLASLTSAAVLLDTARGNLKTNTADLIAADLGEAYKKLGEITGTTAGEEVINRIFERFCLGK